MSIKWSSPDVLPPLGDDEVQVWRIERDGAPARIDRYASLLSTDEQDDAKRLRIGQVRDNFTIGRACLRILLGNASGTDSSAISITTGPHGKPETSAVDGHQISFNIAHSKDTVLIALSRQGAIGVDVEFLDRSTDIMEVARGNFTENESNSLEAIANPEARLKAFYRLWTRKEAIGKADGRGLLLPMASYDVSSDSMDLQPVRVKESLDNHANLYFVSDLDLGDNAVGALAMASAKSRIVRLAFPLQSSL